MSFPRYERYKDSGVEWLGEVPEHWDITRVKRATTFVTGWTPPSGNELFYGGDNLWANISDLGPRILSETNTRITDTAVSHHGMQISPAGSLLFSFKLSIGQVSFAAKAMYTNEAIASFLPDPRLDLTYAYYSWPFFLIENAGENIYGAKLLNQELIRNALIVLPDVIEQQTIGSFLDEETEKLDALIKEQRRLIELLKEKRQTAISQAVTKGLNSNVPMKDSDVNWIGEVPRQWIVTRLGYFATVENGTTPSKEKLEYWTDGQVPWLASGEVNQLRIVEANEFITEQALAESSLRLLPEGTVVVGLVGQGKTRGMSAILGMTATINQNLAAICPGPKISSEYVFYLFQAMYVSLREDGRGGNQAAINCKMLASLQIPVPPIQEQNDIAAFLNTLSEQINTLENESNGAIQLLQEHRSALISAAVTGKIDVRNYNPKEAA
jgi:type I restriction enzyme S subunit